MNDAVIERVARAVAADIARQDYDWWALPSDSLKIAYLDQGEVDFAQVAQAALSAAGVDDLVKALEDMLKLAEEWEGHDGLADEDIQGARTALAKFRGEQG